MSQCRPDFDQRRWVPQIPTGITGAPVGRAMRAIPLRIRCSAPGFGFTAPSGAIAASAPRRIVAIASSRAPASSLSAADGDLAVAAEDPAGDGHIEHLGGDEETHRASTSPCDLDRQAGPVEHADVNEREDRRPREGNVMDTRDPDPEQRPLDRKHERDAEAPPRVQVAARTGASTVSVTRRTPRPSGSPLRRAWRGTLRRARRGRSPG